MINPLMVNTIAGKPSSFHCGPEIKQMKLTTNERNRLRIPTGNWPDTSTAKELNQGLPDVNPASGQCGT